MRGLVAVRHTGADRVYVSREAVAEAVTRRMADGATQREIAVELGCSRGTVTRASSDRARDHNIISSRRRKLAQPSGPCVDGCGRVVYVRNSKSGRCRWCDEEQRVQHWTRERVLFAIDTYARRYGEPPVAASWNPPDWARLPGRMAVHAERWAEGLAPGVPWPYLSQCYGAQSGSGFRRWNEAIAAAGYAPRPSGNHGGRELVAR